MESLQSHFIHTMSHRSSGLPVCFPSWRTRVQTPGGLLIWTGILLLGLSCYISDPDMIWSLASLPFSRCFTRLRADNEKSQRICLPSVGASLGSAPTMCKPTWSHTALLSRFNACCRSYFCLHNRQSGLLGGSPVESLQSHIIHTMSHWSSGLPVCFPSWGTRVQTPGEY
jgi:hypothetical protein